MSINSQEGKSPSIVELQTFVRGKVLLKFQLVDGEIKEGTLKWFDDEAFCLVLGNGTSFTLLRDNVVGYGPV